MYCMHVNKLNPQCELCRYARNSIVIEIDCVDSTFRCGCCQNYSLKLSDLLHGAFFRNFHPLINNSSFFFQVQQYVLLANTRLDSCSPPENFDCDSCHRKLIQDFRKILRFIPNVGIWEFDIQIHKYMLKYLLEARKICQIHRITQIKHHYINESNYFTSKNGVKTFTGMLPRVP